MVEEQFNELILIHKSVRAQIIRVVHLPQISLTEIEEARRVLESVQSCPLAVCLEKFKMTGPEYSALDRLHLQFHVEAERIFQFLVDGRIIEAQKLVTDSFGSVSLDLIFHIKAIYRQEQLSLREFPPEKIST